MSAKSTLGVRLKLALCWIVLLGSWEGAYRVIGWKPWQFPAPSHVVDATLSMLNIQTRFGDPIARGWPWPAPSAEQPAHGANAHAVLPEAMLVSCVRLVIGFSISLILGIGLGMMMWRWQFLDRLLGPVFLGLQTLPSVCWVPVAILTLGINEAAILLVLILGSCFATAIALRDGLRTIPPIYQRAGQMLAAKGWKLYRYVLLPASLPAMASSLRQGFSFAWRSLMGAELLFALHRHGLGFLLSMGRDFSDVAQVVAVMLIMILIGMAADRWVFAQLEWRIRRRFGLLAGS